MDRKKKPEIIEVRSVMWDFIWNGSEGKKLEKEKGLTKIGVFLFALASALSLSFLVVMMESGGVKDRLILLGKC